MLTTRDLLAAVKSAQGLPSNYRLARFLDIPETTVQRWNTGRNLPDDAMCARLAELAGLDAGFVIACVHAERATDAAMRSVWSAMAARLQAAGATLGAVILSAGLVASPDASAMGSYPAGGGKPAGLYIMSTALRALARILARLACAPTVKVASLA